MMRQLVRSDGKVYDTISDAALEIVNENGCGKLDTTRANICNAANGHARSAYGFGWQWREPLGDAYDEALRKIAHLEEVNGSLCAEINKQERVIERQRELIANRDESIRNLTKLLDKRQERVKALESLVLDWAMAPCAVCDPWDEHFACEHFDGHDCTLGIRMAELGIELDA